MSAFGGLTTAYTGLVAARQGLDVVGDNITNATTVGYSRQELTTTSVVAANEGVLVDPVQPGQGVSVTGVTRVDSPLLDAQVRSTSSADSFATERSAVTNSIESALGEPSSNGLSSSLQQFWSDWQSVANQSTSAASATTVIADGTQLAAQLAGGYNAASSQWALTRSNVDGLVSQVNAAATQIAQLNAQVRAVLATGGNANGLLDQQNSLATTIASLAGGTVRAGADGTMDVLLGGNALVNGTTVHAIVASGSTTLAGAAASPLTIGFVDNPAATTAISSGTLGADLALLAPANVSGTGGTIAQAAQSYSDIATVLATSVNVIHEQGANQAGTTGLDFFAIDPNKPAALGLSVIPTDASGIAASTPGAGAANGDVADRIAQLTTSTSGPDTKWSAFVVAVGIAAKSATAQSALSGASAANALSNQQAQSSVSTDQETTTMLTYQHAFDGAARVMTAIDQMLDTLIHKTGLAGIS